MRRKLSAKFKFYSALMGFDTFKFSSFFKGLSFYFSDLKELKAQNRQKNEFKFGRFYPILYDKYDESGVMKGHYFHQDLLIASKIYKAEPERHIDIGSRIDGFVAHVATFRTIEIFDIRPVLSQVENIIFTQADLTKLSTHLIACCDSISSLHAIEHFGLGRYGDQIDIEGHVKAIKNIHQILKPGGKFYFSTPIGEQRIEFNAHRVFSVAYLIDLLSPLFHIDNFSYVDENGDLVKDTPLLPASIEDNFGCSNYGCGIFELTRRG